MHFLLAHEAVEPGRREGMVEITLTKYLGKSRKPKTTHSGAITTYATPGSTDEWYHPLIQLRTRL
jgi:hypothetical protein